MMCSFRFALTAALVSVLLFAPSCEEDPGRGEDAEIEIGFDVADADAADSIDDSVDGDRTDPVDDGVDFECEDPVVVTTASEILAELEDIEFAYVGPYTSQRLPITKELSVVGSVTLRGEDVAVPDTCQGRTDCRHEVFFQLGGSVDGVTLQGTDDELPWMTDNPEVVLTNTTVRLRPVLFDTHPSMYNFVPIVLVMPPCDAPCDEGATKCPFDQVCYSSSGAYCRLCELEPKEVCACWTPEGPMDEQTECSFMVSGDVMCMGHCDADGVCQSDNPGWAGCP